LASELDPGGELELPSSRAPLDTARRAPAAGARVAAATLKGGTAPTLVWLALGASIGGPAALRELLAELPSPLPLRVVIVQHIAHGVERTLGDWLQDELGMNVRSAVEGELPPVGAVRLAPAGAHLRVTAAGRLSLDAESPPRGGHRPSIDELFRSLAATFPRQTAAVLLSGSGEDGAVGLLALRRAGAFCLVQDEASAAAFGMPRAALELGAAELALAPRDLGRRLAQRLAGRA
jgi:chemotaxis response regulator CheB